MKRLLAVIILVAAVLAWREAGPSILAQSPPVEDEASLRARARAALSQTTGEMALHGLSAPVEVVRDRWGVPHIFAKNTHDLFFAQGFVAAQDRLWQLDLWRRMAEGTLAEVVGPTVVNRDIFARLLRYRGDMEAEWQAYRPDARAIVEAFVAGVNAQIALATGTPGKLPIEFQLTGTRPEPWTPEVVIGRMAGYVMTRNARTEVQRARLVRGVGADRASELAALEPATRLKVPDGLDLADVSDEILALTNGISESVAFPADVAQGTTAAARSSSDEVGPSPRIFEFAVSPLDVRPEEIGSNDWVVSGRLTATGKPLLANDPHRALLLPSLRYTVHLNAPGWNVIGAGEPALPGIAAGHNDRVAFGFTIVGIDQQDLYVEQLDPSDHSRYRYRGAWEPVRVERERVVVRGQAARDVQLRFTRHGPVIHVDEAKHRAYALRWVGAEPGAAGYLRSLALNTVSNWREFRAAVAGWKVPSENLIYADVDGNIGWIAAGLSPVRPNWDGLLPVPGQDGKYEWRGFLGVDDLPQIYNPASGLIATANHNVLPAGYAHSLGFEFGAPFRFARILDVLTTERAESKKFTVETFERLQHDERSLAAVAVSTALQRAIDARGARAFDASPDPATAREAARMITSWDGTLSKSSSAAALYQTWLPRLTRALSERWLSAEDRASAPSALTTERVVRALADAGLAPVSPSLDAWVDGTPRVHAPRVHANLEVGATPSKTKRAAGQGSQTGVGQSSQTGVGQGSQTGVGQSSQTAAGQGSQTGVGQSSSFAIWPKADLRQLLVSILTGPTLLEAWRDLEGRLGPAAGWEWGRMHRAFFEHPLASTPARKTVFNTGDEARGGDSTTPNATGTGPRQTAGASFREVIDVSNWDRSMTINVPGLSGQPGSAHYADLFPVWTSGRYHPLPFSRQAIDAAAAERLLLVPAAAR